MEMTRRKSLTGARFLHFTLGDEAYCIDILKVKELVGMPSITPLPQTPDYIRGVINLRGKIIPVVDLRLKFGLEFKEYSKRTSIIVVDVEFEKETLLMGIVVDAIQEVLSIPQEKISKMPYINAKIKKEFVTGVADTPEGMKILLDVVKILNNDDFVLIKNTEAGD